MDDKLPHKVKVNYALTVSLPAGVDTESIGQWVACALSAMLDQRISKKIAIEFDEGVRVDVDFTREPVEVDGAKLPPVTGVLTVELPAMGLG